MKNPKQAPLSFRRWTGRLFILMVPATLLLIAGGTYARPTIQRSRTAGPAAADGATRSTPIIIDHNCIDVSRIPNGWITQIKSQIKLHYAHTSHGGQLTTGIDRLDNPSLPVHDPRLDNTLVLRSLPSASGLCIMDGQLSQTYITPDLYWQSGGDSYTRASLNTYSAINVSMWSWCSQVNTYTWSQVNVYLNTMAALEAAYPNVTFVYMTGNAQATGALGFNRYYRNQQIREYCRENNKVLFDFADLDAWYNGVKATISTTASRSRWSTPISTAINPVTPPTPAASRRGRPFGGCWPGSAHPNAGI